MGAEGGQQLGSSAVAGVGSGQGFEAGNVREAGVLRPVEQLLEWPALNRRGEIEDRAARRGHRDRLVRGDLAARGQDRVADRVHAPMNHVQPPRADAAAHRAVGESEPPQLLARDHSVLVRRERRQGRSRVG